MWKLILSENGGSASISKGILKYLIIYVMVDTTSNVLTSILVMRYFELIFPKTLDILLFIMYDNDYFKL